VSTTRIEWATHVYNAFTGCDRVSAGCARCYAIPTAAANQRKELGRARRARELGQAAPRRRYFTDGDPRTSGPGFGFTVHWDKLERPERFPPGARVFVNSMSDVFHEAASPVALAALWRVFASRPDVSWLVLTKRAERMHEVLGGWRDAAEAFDAAGVPSTPELLEDPDAPAWRQWIDGLPNVWLGVTVENRSVLHRADLLRDTPAAVRFISAEPLLGPLVPHALGDAGWLWWYRGELVDRADAPGLELAGVDWLITGGESGPGHRLVRAEWVRDLRGACARSSTAFFFKQWGGQRPTSGGRELDGRTWDQLPAATPRGLAR
jgi:protein gp37